MIKHVRLDAAHPKFFHQNKLLKCLLITKVKSDIISKLNDYAFFIAALLDLYGTTFEVKHLSINYLIDFCDFWRIN